MTGKTFFEKGQDYLNKRVVEDRPNDLWHYTDKSELQFASCDQEVLWYLSKLKYKAELLLFNGQTAKYVGFNVRGRKYPVEFDLGERHCQANIGAICVPSGFAETLAA